MIEIILYTMVEPPIVYIYLDEPGITLDARVEVDGLAAT
jgi:hypothetical protein